MDVTRKIAPVAPKIIPKDLVQVIRSPKRKNEIISTIMGVEVIITEPIIGEVRLMPLKKKIWLTATPKMAETKNLPRSFLEGVTVGPTIL